MLDVDTTAAFFITVNLHEPSNDLLNIVRINGHVLGGGTVKANIDVYSIYFDIAHSNTQIILTIAVMVINAVLLMLVII